jgi:hypothetical protein
VIPLVLSTLLGTVRHLTTTDDEESKRHRTRSSHSSRQNRRGAGFGGVSGAHGPTIKPKTGGIVYSEPEVKPFIEEMNHGNMQPHFSPRLQVSPMPNVLSRTNGA